jgi:glycosyltransferase involved in cell wall biosynthesis
MNAYRPDYVVNGETGFLVESDQQLCEKLDFLLQDRQLRRSMAAAAARHSMKFDWDLSAARWVEVFREVVAKSYSP